jgi:hypothetical protein
MLRGFLTVAYKFGFCLLSAILLGPWLKIDLTVLKGKRLCEIFWLMTKCTLINGISISIFSLLYVMVQGMKIPFESSFLGRPCIWFRCIFYFNFLVDIKDSFKLVKTLIIAGEHLNAAGYRL